MADCKKKIPPRGNIIHATARREKSFESCLWELIDNAINAGATVITITCSREFIRIEDNGAGCANLDSMVVLGLHVEQPGNRNGYWGIGGTESYIMLGGADSECLISSIHAGVRRQTQIVWREVADSEWGYPEPLVSEADPGAAGTTIVIRPLVKAPRSWESLPQLIAEKYWPALDRVRISVRTPKHKAHELVVPPVFPNLLPGAIDTIIRFGNYEAHVICGIVPPDCKNTMAGFTYFAFPRVIRLKTDDGAGDHSVAQIFGRVELRKGWSKGGLSAFKSEFDAADRLYAEVARVCEPVLKKADELGENLELKRFNSDVSDLVAGMMGFAQSPDAKAKRGRGDKDGAVEPTGSGKPHTQAEREQNGKTFPGKGSGSNVRLRVSHKPLGGDVAGEVKEREIILNTDRALVSAAFRQKDKRLSAMLALCLWNEYRAFNPKRGKRRSAQTALSFDDPACAKILAERLGKLLDAYSDAAEIAPAAIAAD